MLFPPCGPVQHFRPEMVALALHSGRGPTRRLWTGTAWHSSITWESPGIWAWEIPGKAWEIPGKGTILFMVGQVVRLFDGFLVFMSDIAIMCIV